MTKLSINNSYWWKNNLLGLTLYENHLVNVTEKLEQCHDPI
jgi:hypothetical protein